MFNLSLKEIYSSAFLCELQEQISVVTGVSIHIVDYKGVTLTNHSRSCEFCQAIRNHPAAGKRCRKCDALAGLEAARRGTPFAYFCHCGLLDVAIPILFNNQYLGAIILGQVRLYRKEEAASVLPLLAETTCLVTDCPGIAQELSKFYAQLPEMEYSRIMEIAKMTGMIFYTIISEKEKHHNECLMYEWMMKNGTYPQSPRNTFENMQAHYKTSQAVQMQENSLPVPPDSVLYPAVRYIHKHPKEKITMNAMANLCHLSPSYFSRLFKRETGENFREYVNQLKIQKSKEMMRNTNQSVSSISNVLGFRDLSYFIKVFKKSENITPYEYQKRCK